MEFKTRGVRKVTTGINTTNYYQSLVMFLNIAKLDNTEESVDVGIGIFLLNVVVSAGENELATHLDAGKSLEP